VYILWKLDKQGEAKKLFGELRTMAAVADLDTPVFERLKPLAAELGWPEDWRTPAATPSDIGVRPPLDSLGPIRWSPPAAPALELTTLEGKKISLSQYRGRNVVFIFYLGFGCLHCTEQLKAFKPLNEEFRKAGIEIVAVATDTPEALRNAQAALGPDDKYPFAIVSNDDLSVFKKYRAYDDFEKQALHATVLVDGYGRLRWIDVGPDPFSDAKFVLGESKRLLSFTPSAAEATALKGAEE
jgi:peroxiredoxin